MVRGRVTAVIRSVYYTVKVDTEVWAIQFLTAGYENDWGFGQSDLVKDVPAHGMGCSLKDPSNPNLSVIL